MKQWRVGSITLGLILIILGITFAIGNVYGFEVVGKVIKWWPVILIIFGIEVLLSSIIPKSSKKMKFDGISVFLALIIFVITGTLFVGSNVFRFNKTGITIGGFINNYKFESNFKNHKAINPKSAQKLFINSMFANIKLEKSSNNNIELDADVNILNNNEVEAKKIADSIINVNQGEEIKIDTNKYSQHNSRYRISNLNITIYVPEKIYVDINNQHGRVEGRSLTSGIKVINTNGSINISSSTGDVICESKNGKIQVDSIKGKVQIKNQSGNIEAKNIEKELKAESRYGYIVLDKINGNTTAQNENGKIEISNIKGNVEAEGANGNIYLKDIDKNVVVRNKNTVIDAEGINGDFKCENKYGNIKVKNILGKIDISSENGSVDITNSSIRNKDLKVSNENGSVKVTFAKGQKGKYTLESIYGKVYSNNLELKSNKDDNREKIDRILGNDLVKINITNKNGNISVNN